MKQNKVRIWTERERRWIIPPKLWIEVYTHRNPSESFRIGPYFNETKCLLDYCQLAMEFREMMR